MRYTIVVSTLLVASVGAIHVDSTAEPAYYARDVQTESYLHIRDVDGFFTTILPRSPGGGSPGASGSRPLSPKSERQPAQKVEAKVRSGSPVPPGSPSGKSSSTSPPGSPSKGGSGGRSGASSSKADTSSKGRAGSPENPFAAAAKDALPHGNAKAFPATKGRLRVGGTLMPQPRRRPKMFDTSAPRSSAHRTPFGRPEPGRSGLGREGITSIGGDGSGRSRPPGLPLSRPGPKGDAGPSSSQSEHGPAMEKRSTEDQEMHIYFARFLDDRPINDVYIKSLADAESLWTRDVADGKTILEARGNTLNPKNGNGGNGGQGGNAGSAGRETTRRSSGDTRRPVRANSPATESPPRQVRQMIPPLSISSPRNMIPNGIPNGAPNGAPQSPNTRTGWSAGRSILRHDEPNSEGSGNRHVSFANPVETQILPQGPSFSRPSSAESLESLGR